MVRSYRSGAVLAACLVAAVLALPGDSGAAPGYDDPVTQGNEPYESAVMVEADQPRDRIPADEVHDGLYVRRLNLELIGKDGVSLTVKLDPDEPVDGNGAVVGHLPQDAPLCLNRPIVRYDQVGKRALSFATDVARRMGISVGPVGSGAELTPNEAWWLIEAPEWAKFSAVQGDHRYDTMLSRMYGTPIDFPTVSEILTAGHRVIKDGDVYPCPPGGATTVSEGYRDVFHQVAGQYGFTVIDNRTGIGPGDYFLVPGITAAVTYQYLRLNKAAPTLQVSHRTKPVIFLPTQFWVDRQQYPISMASAEVVEGNPVSVTAFPHLVLHFDDGVTLTCDDTGTQDYRPAAAGDLDAAAREAYERKTCMHTFTTPGPHDVTAQVVYDVGWGHGSNLDDKFQNLQTGDASTITLPVVGVGEIQAVN